MPPKEKNVTRAILSQQMTGKPSKLMSTLHKSSLLHSAHRSASESYHKAKGDVTIGGIIKLKNAAAEMEKTFAAKNAYEKDASGDFGFSPYNEIAKRGEPITRSKHASHGARRVRTRPTTESHSVTVEPNPH